MSKLDNLPERAMELASQAGGALRDMAPKASSMIRAGLTVEAVKSGARAGMMVVRRNPAITVATLAGAGLLWYATRRRARRAENGNSETIEGSARRIETRNGKASTAKEGARTRRKSTAGTRRTSRTRGAATEPRTEH